MLLKTDKSLITITEDMQKLFIFAKNRLTKEKSQTKKLTNQRSYKSRIFQN